MVKKSGLEFCSDESWIELFGKNNRQNNRYRTKKKCDVPPFLKPKNGLKVMGVGGFYSRGVNDLHVVSKGQTVNGKYYRVYIASILRFYGLFFTVSEPKKNNFPTGWSTIPYGEGVHEDVGSRPCSTWGKGVWPGNSPDVNPIENLWGILKDSAYEDPKPTNMETLVARFRKKWFSLPVQLLKNMSESFKSRIEEVLDAQGGKTTY